MNISEKFKGFDIIKETRFIKDFNKENPNLKKLEEIMLIVSDNEIKKQIEKDMSLIKWGLEGENNVYFELKNSLLPMICMHDIRLQVGDLFAQIDFLILTNKFFYILETKHLVGDIKVNSDGDFIRITSDEHGNKREEGMYNPVTQGNRHSRILKKFLEINNLLNVENFPVKSIAILANPKTILDKKEAPPHIRNNIYRCDQIVHFLQKEFSSLEYEVMISDSKLEFIGEEILANHSPIEYNYESKYKLSLKKPDESTKDIKRDNKDSVNDEKEVLILDYKDAKSKMESELKKIRKIKSKELNLKAYELFNDKQLVSLLTYLPKSLLELNNLKIIPQKGSYHMGTDIVRVINEYSVNSNMEIKNDNKINNDNLKVDLQKYRKKKSQDLSIEEFKVFTNDQLSEILRINPSSISDLKGIKGFNDYHIQKYGEEIINVVNNKKQSLYAN